MTVYTRSAEILRADPDQPIRAVLATSAPQGDGLALQMTGLNLGPYRANPVLMISHDHQRLPVGRVEDLRVERDRVTGELRFASDPEAQVVETRVREKVVSALSIGFDVNWPAVDADGRAWAWTLRETSVVPVGMDADALVYSRSAAPHLARRRLLDALQLADPAGRRILAELDQAAQRLRT